MSSSIPVITELDAARIRELGAHLPDRGRGLEPLESLIGMVTEEADIVPREHVGADVVTVNSTVSFREPVADRLHTVTLVYPRDVEVGERRISILSPVGQALLGRRVGDSTLVHMPDGARRELRIAKLHYQPEAAGDPL